MTAMATGPAGVWPDLADPRFSQLLRHWAEGRRGLMPARSAIDPIAIKGCLPNIWLHQYLPDEGDFRCALAGEAVNVAWGASIVGKRMRDFMPPSMLSTVLDSYRQTLHRPALQVSRRRITRPDRVEQSAERLVLPLADDAGRPSSLIGITLYYLGAQPRIDDPRAMEGVVTLYDCAGLPAEPPPG